MTMKTFLEDFGNKFDAYKLKNPGEDHSIDTFTDRFLRILYSRVQPTKVWEQRFTNLKMEICNFFDW
jgi:hypothetical protein